MNIRQATMEDLEAITAVEALCFPPAEAAEVETIRKRLEVFPNHFWLLFDGARLVGFINGMVSNSPIIYDSMFADASMHDENGKWQLIFGVDTIPEYRNRGCAAMVLRQVIEDAQRQERAGLVLTCKEELIRFYEKFGFINEGKAISKHGGAVWYDMRLQITLDE